MKHKYSLLFSLAALCSNCLAQSNLAIQDLNAPFGWVCASSLTSGDSYTVTGGGVSTSSNTITLKSSGSDMKATIANAIKKYNVVILDGSDGDFVISSSMDLNSLSNKTIVGINGARLCTEFYLTEEFRNALDAANVKNLSSSSGTGGTLYKSDGVTVKTTVSEQRELVTRQTLINLTGDDDESYIKAGIFNVKSCTNIIIRNIKFVGPGPCDVGGYDLISATGTKHLWVDHCEFTDGIDGNFDITKSSDLNSVTWCTFSYTDRAYDHMNTNLIGSSDTEAADYLNTTMANNIWGYKCNQRMPMARAGNIHLINNFYNCPGNSCAINPRKNSEFLIENNYFATGVKQFSASEALSYLFVDNYSEDTYSFSSYNSTSVPYDYLKFDVADVPSVLSATNGAGATLSDPLVIGRSIDLPSVNSSVSYTGAEMVGVELPLYSQFLYAVSGTTSASAVGSYSVTFSLVSPYDSWSDGSSADKVVSWSIVDSQSTSLSNAKAALAMPSKVVENGRLLIIRDGRKYNLSGSRVM